MPWTDVFLPNTDEAAIITRLDDPVEQAAWFRAAGAGVVAITLGEHGTVMLADGIRVKAGVYPTTFVGSTGAGDAFDAGYIAGMIAGEDCAGLSPLGSARCGKLRPFVERNGVAVQSRRITRVSRQT
ncbi:MAG: PfkB family carbohydrate kinase [Pirellulales bacterium]